MDDKPLWITLVTLAALTLAALTFAALTFYDGIFERN